MKKCQQLRICVGAMAFGMLLSFLVGCENHTGQSVDLPADTASVPARSVPTSDAMLPNGEPLPPDPGAANDTTRLGIDSDHDGVRDDIARAIVLSIAPGDTDMQSALIGKAKLYQHILAAAGTDHDVAYQLADTNRAVNACLSYVDRGSAQKFDAQVFAQEFNTTARSEAYLAYDQLLDHYVDTLVPETVATCHAQHIVVHARKVVRAKQVLVFNAGPIRMHCAAESKSHMVVMYGNGVGVTQSSDDWELRLVHDQFTQSFPSGNVPNVTYQAPYNRTASRMRDLYQSAKEKKLLDDGTTSFWLFVMYPELVGPAIDYANLVDTLIDTTAGKDVDVSNEAALIRADILEGKAVLLVTHSQGGLIGNLAWNALHTRDYVIPDHSLALVEIATPAHSVPGGGEYTTLTQDLVISKLTSIGSPFALAKQPAPANVTNDPKDIGDTWAHSLQFSYFTTGSDSVRQIRGQIHDMAGTLVAPPAQAQSGIISYTLRWNKALDLDAHVFEPTGDHVYYLNSRGDIGALDDDAVDGYGAEHYTAPCARVAHGGEGTYTVAVNDFMSFAPAEGKAVIVAGPLVRVYPFVIPRADGEAGNDDPTPIAHITVSGDEAQEGLRFEVSDARPKDVIPHRDVIIETPQTIWDTAAQISVGPQWAFVDLVRLVSGLGLSPGYHRLYVSIVCRGEGEMRISGGDPVACTPGPEKSTIFDTRSAAGSIELRTSDGSTMSAIIKILVLS